MGPEAGSSVDPFNTAMVDKLIRDLRLSSTNVDLPLFNYFRQIFGVNPEKADKLDATWDPAEPRSQVFLGFDFDTKMAGKAYFMPMLKAMESGKSRLQLVSEGISELEGQGVRMESAFAMLKEYLTSCSQQSRPEIEIVAVDCKDSHSSRVKIYIRSPQTSFDAVRDVYTLGGRLNGANTHEELSALKELWHLVLGIADDFPPDRELSPVSPSSHDHRTSGILYYFAIEPGLVVPHLKVYIPVRHYAKNDRQIARGLVEYFRRRKWWSVADSYMKDLERML
jgi:DMATS type aromatic prenyltransferase